MLKGSWSNTILKPPCRLLRTGSQCDTIQKPAREQGLNTKLSIKPLPTRRLLQVGFLALREDGADHSLHSYRAYHSHHSYLSDRPPVSVEGCVTIANARQGAEKSEPQMNRR